MGVGHGCRLMEVLGDLGRTMGVASEGDGVPAFFVPLPSVARPIPQDEGVRR